MCFGGTISSLLLKKTVGGPDLLPAPQYHLCKERGEGSAPAYCHLPDTGFQITTGSMLVISDFQREIPIMFPMMHRLQRKHDEDGHGSEGRGQGGIGGFKLSHQFETNEIF